MKNTATLQKVKKGRYIIDVTVGQLYFRDGESQELQKIGNSGVWTRARCIAADKHWLYIVDNGELYRVHPQTGDPNRLNFFRGALTRSVWFDHSWLYVIARTNSAVDNQQIFAEIWRLKPNQPEVKECVAKRVRMDMPSYEQSPDREIYLDIS